MLGDAQMHQFAFGASQSIADLAQRIGVGQLAEHHGHELGPAGEPLGGSFRQMLLDQRGEFRSREMLQKLIEQAGSLYHNNALLEAGDGTDMRVRSLHYVDRKAHLSAMRQQEEANRADVAYVVPSRHATHTLYPSTLPNSA